MKAELTLQQQIERKLNRVNADVIETKEKLNADFIHNFKWSYADKVYALLFEQRVLTSILREIVKDLETPEMVVAYFVKRYTNEILNGGFTERSTLPSSNTAHAIEKETTCEVLKFLKQL